MIDFLAKILTFWIINKNLRRKIRNNLKTLWFGKQIFRVAKSIGKGLSVGNYSKINNNTIIGKHVSINGLNIYGQGDIAIGNYVHIGRECMIISQNHNYELKLKKLKLL